MEKFDVFHLEVWERDGVFFVIEQEFYCDLVLGGPEVSFLDFFVNEVLDVGELYYSAVSVINLYVKILPEVFLDSALLESLGRQR